MNLNYQAHLQDQPAYRQKQIKQAVFVDLYEDWNQATTLSKDLKNKLDQTCPLKIDTQIFPSDEQNLVKAVITLSDGLKTETVLMRHTDGRSTVCVSTQVGCPLACQFCATGQMGFKRNLTIDEIFEQVIFFARLLKKENKRPNNIVFMGMGEPFLNYDNLLAAIKILHDPEGFNLGMRHFSISTIGLVPGIQKMMVDLHQVNLAISLHAPNDQLRISLMPATAKHPLEELLKTIQQYTAQTNRRVMFEYMLLKDINDQPEHARELARLINSNPLYFINLVRYNTTQAEFKPSSKKQTNQFKTILADKRTPFTQRYSFGTDIHAACGQLVAD